MAAAGQAFGLARAAPGINIFRIVKFTVRQQCKRDMRKTLTDGRWQK